MLHISLEAKVTLFRYRNVIHISSYEMNPVLKRVIEREARGGGTWIRQFDSETLILGNTETLNRFVTAA